MKYLLPLLVLVLVGCRSDTSYLQDQIIRLPSTATNIKLLDNRWISFELTTDGINHKYLARNLDYNNAVVVQIK